MAYNMLMQSELLESILVDANIVMHMMLSSLCTTKSSLAFLCNILQMHHVLCLSCFLCFFASKSIKHRYFCPSFYLFGQNTDINIYTSESSNLSNLQVLSSLERKILRKTGQNTKKIPELIASVNFSEMKWYHWFTISSLPSGDFMFKVNKRNSRKMCEICSKLTIKTPERRHFSASWNHQEVFCFFYVFRG